MGKRRIVKKGDDRSAGSASSTRSSRRKLDTGVLYVEATYNNTKVSLTDDHGNLVAWSSSGSIGFSGAKKGTPFAAAKVGEFLGDKAAAMGVKEVAVIISVAITPGQIAVSNTPAIEFTSLVSPN